MPSGRRVTDSFKPTQTLKIAVTLDPAKAQITAVINGKTITYPLPKDGSAIQYYGYYVKGTTTAFSPIRIQPASQLP